MTTSTRITVLGGGPAGVVTAIGLARLGYQVTILNQPRRFDALEGISDRVIQALKHLQLNDALAVLPEASARRVMWNGRTSANNHETLIRRPVFDAALLSDALHAGVSIQNAQVVSWHAGEEDGVRIEFLSDGETQTITTDFVVEARGRAAPLGNTAARIRGPEAVSLLQYWRPHQGQQTVAPFSSVQSFADGWAWLACAEDGHRFLQLTLDVASANMPDKSRLSDFCRERIEKLEIAAPFIADAAPEGIPHARASTPILAGKLIGSRFLRVGDAAVAGDPLSGSGIFLAFSAALQAPAVIHTLLQYPERAELAKEFHIQRLTGLFYRFARMGRDFYTLEKQWPERPFWAMRRGFPDNEPLHPHDRPDNIRICKKPVLAANQIIEHEVVVSPNHPLGVWRFEDIELAPALRLLQGSGSNDHALRRFTDHYGETAAQKLWAWMDKEGWIARGSSN